MATHSSTLAQKIPWTEEPGRLQSMGSKESDTTEWHQCHVSRPMDCYFHPSNLQPGRQREATTALQKGWEKLTLLLISQENQWRGCITVVCRVGVEQAGFIPAFDFAFCHLSFMSSCLCTLLLWLVKPESSTEVLIYLIVNLFSCIGKRRKGREEKRTEENGKSSVVSCFPKASWNSLSPTEVFIYFWTIFLLSWEGKHLLAYYRLNIYIKPENHKGSKYLLWFFNALDLNRKKALMERGKRNHHFK